MSVEFDNTAYYQAFISEHTLDKVGMKNNQKFSYNEVKNDQISKFHNDSGWLGRAIIALPAAAWCGIAKVIYHLAKATILCALGVSDKPGIYFKVQIYSAVRDLQESFGYILAVFSDKQGSYHKEQASFHKSCYECFLMSDVDIRINQDVRQVREKIYENIKKLDDGVAEVDRMRSQENTKSLNEFKEFVEIELSKLKLNIEKMNVKEKATPEYKKRFIETCINITKSNIEWQIKMRKMVNAALTNEKINTILDSFIANWTGDDYSFLSELKV